MAQTVKNLPTTWETQVQSLGQEDPLEEGMATYLSILAWRIPWTEEPGGRQHMEMQSQTRLKQRHTRTRFTLGYSGSKVRSARGAGAEAQSADSVCSRPGTHLPQPGRPEVRKEATPSHVEHEPFRQAGWKDWEHQHLRCAYTHTYTHMYTHLLRTRPVGQAAVPSRQRMQNLDHFLKMWF